MRQEHSWSYGIRLSTGFSVEMVRVAFPVEVFFQKSHGVTIRVLFSSATGRKSGIPDIWQISWDQGGPGSFGKWIRASMTLRAKVVI